MPGGLRFGTYRADRISTAYDLPEPEEVILPIGIPAGDASVAEGDTVVTGQSLVPDGLIKPGQYHLSTVTGTVDRFIRHGKGMRAPSSAVIRRSGDDRYHGEPLAVPTDGAGIRDFLVQTGIIHACSTDVADWILSPQRDVSTLIISGFSTAPQASGGIDTVEAFTDEFREGCRMWSNLFQDAEIIVAARADEFHRWHALELDELSFKLYGYDNRYPLEHPGMLGSSIRGEDIIGRGSSMDHGIAVLDTWSILSTGRAALLRRPLTHMRTEIFGEGTKEPVRLTVRIGTPARVVKETATSMPVRLISGGVLAGKELRDESPLLPGDGVLTALPLPKRRFMGFAVPAFTRHSWTRTVASALLPGILLEAKAEVGGELRPCISCGACENVCPVSISPSFLFRVSDAEVIEEMEQHAIERCIACGLCSYVCPSKIDLMGKILAGIERLEAERAE